MADILYNLALNYDRQAKYAKDEPLYLRSMAISEKTLGSNHPYVKDCLKNLAKLYRSTAQYKKAKEIQKRLSHAHS